MTKTRLNVILILLCFLLSACSLPSKIVFSMGLGKNDVFYVDDVYASKNEFMVYLLSDIVKYEESFDRDIWEYTDYDESLEAGIKSTALERLARIKTMYKLARSNEIVLSDDENDRVREVTNTFYENLGTNRNTFFDELDIEDVYNMYYEYALANKLYVGIIQNINPEISDDEARMVTVLQMTIEKSGEETDEGTPVNRANSAVSALSEGNDFLSVANKYGDYGAEQKAYGQYNTEDEIADVVFELDSGEISKLIETDSRYYIFKCINMLDREETDANKLRIIELRRDEAFALEYDEYASKLARQLNEKIYKKIKIPYEEWSAIPDEDTEKFDFFKVYNDINVLDEN